MAVYTSHPSVAPEASNLPTVCVFCSQNCGLRVDVAEGRIASVRADDDNPLTKGYSCNKAYRIAHYAEHAQRLTQPLKRQPDGTHAPISWEQATREVGERLESITSAHGPDAFALVGLGGQANHLGVPYGLAMLLGSGSQWWFNALAQEKTQRALVDDWMVGAPSDTMQVGDPEHADVAVVFGSNFVVSQRGVAPGETARDFHRDDSRKLVIVDPRRTETARKADQHIAIAPGTDAWLLLGLAAVIVDEERYDETFVRDRTAGLAEIKMALADVDVDEIAQRCGVEPDVLRTLARELAEAEHPCVDMDLGLEQSLFNTLTAYLGRLIMALLGSYGHKGGAIFVSSAMPRLPSPKGERPTAKVSGIPGIAIMGPTPMFSPALFAEEVLTDDEARIRAVIVDGANPALQVPDTASTKAAFERLELSVVMEVAMTETARLADYVLPAPTGYEKWEFSGFPKPFPILGLQLRPPVLQPKGDTLPEAEIYHRIALASKITRPAPAPVRALARYARGAIGGWFYLATLAALALLYGRRPARAGTLAFFWTYETLGPQLPAPQLTGLWLICQGLAWTRRDDVARALPDAARRLNRVALGTHLFELALQHPEGVVMGRVDEARHLEEHTTHRDGRIQLAPPQMLSEIARALAAAPTDPDYPLVLNGGMRTRWTANTIGRDPKWRKGRGPHCALWLSPQDAEALGVAQGADVRVRSRTGAVSLPAKVDASVRPGHVHIPNGFGTRFPDPETGELRTEGVCINDLADAQDRDPFTGCPHLKYIRVVVEPIAVTTGAS